MKRFKISLFFVVFVCLFFVSVSARAATTKSIIDDAVWTLREMEKQEDVSSMAVLVDNGHGVAIVPNMLKAGLILGGQHGYGLILARKNKEWYGPSFFEMTGGSIGFQIGAQKVALLFCINNQAGMKAFTDNKSKLGTNVGLTAGPVGREAGAATDGSLKASIYSYSMSKGLFAGVNLDGTAVGANHKMNSEYWGKKLSIEDALNQKASKSDVKELLAELNKIMKRK
ncbi:MAG: lipid-binding SYLF domain-containing protein [Synergistaceae bacterium]|nr:lipid-binding SYLF domain-containing protein [Synergistaceae bacterium]